MKVFFGHQSVGQNLIDGIVDVIAEQPEIEPERLMSYRMSGSERIYLMDAQYSDDGGHLNELGRKIVAEQLLITLAEAANGRGLSETSSPR
jgi:lysophospholipase L1-like esterase